MRTSKIMGCSLTPHPIQYPGILFIRSCSWLLSKQLRADHNRSAAGDAFHTSLETHDLVPDGQLQGFCGLRFRSELDHQLTAAGDDTVLVQCIEGLLALFTYIDQA